MGRECPVCGISLEGMDARAKFCCKEHRWIHHRRAAYDMAKKSRMDPDILAALPPEEPKVRKVGGTYAKNKGARVEREVCDILTAKTGTKVTRILGQARDGGADVAWGPFTIEVKARETVAMPAWQAQVMAAVDGTDQIPAIVWRRKNEKFWIALPFETFVDLFEMLRKAAELGVGNGRNE